MEKIASHECAECRAGDHEFPEPAVALVSHPNPDHPNLKIRKWVCGDHLMMLYDDYGIELKIVEKRF
jgi:hypothetical protein